MDAVIPDADRRRQEADFRKTAPKFYLGDKPWTLFLDHFTETRHAFQAVVQNEGASKNILYCSLTGQAFALASPEFKPSVEPYRDVTFLEYCMALGELFEPASESEQIKIEFERRSQKAGEHPTLYYRDKKNLFDRSFSREKRDYSLFYNTVISGLANQEMRNYLRLNFPEPLEDTTQFKLSLLKIANVVRRRYMDNEIGQAETIGAEAHTSSASYTSTGDSQRVNLGRVKQEHGVFEMGARRGKCFHCQSTDHFIAQCPRKASGLPQVVQAVQPGIYQTQDEGYPQMDANAWPEDADVNNTVNAMPANRQFSGHNRPFGGQNRNFGGQNRNFGMQNTSQSTRTPNGQFARVQVPQYNRVQPQHARGQNGDYTGPNGQRRFIPKTNSGRGWNKKNFTKRVAVVYESEDGEWFLDNDPETKEQPEGGEQALEGVNALDLEARIPEGFSEADYIPGAFLGM